MRILVMGGTRFIGVYLTQLLLEQGHEVVIYDVEMPRFSQECAFVRGDIRDIDRMAGIIESGDIVYHLAAEANVNRFYESPVYSNDITANGVLHVLEAMRLDKMCLAAAPINYY